jgi:hypothetical protein
MGIRAYEELAARPGDRPKGRANRGAAIRAGDLGPAIWRANQLPAHCWLAYTRANPKDVVVRSRRYLMNGLMDGLIAGHLAESTVSCTPIDASPDLYACATGECGGMNDQHGISGTHTLPRVVNAGEEGLGHG